MRITLSHRLASLRSGQAAQTPGQTGKGDGGTLKDKDEIRITK